MATLIWVHVQRVLFKSHADIIKLTIPNAEVLNAVKSKHSEDISHTLSTFEKNLFDAFWETFENNLITS